MCANPYARPWLGCTFLFLVGNYFYARLTNEKIRKRSATTQQEECNNNLRWFTQSAANLRFIHVVDFVFQLEPIDVSFVPLYLLSTHQFLCTYYA